MLLNSNLKNIYKLKKYNIDNISIGAGDCVSIPISGISGYYPIGSFFYGRDGENVINSLPPRARENDNSYEVKLFNYYTENVSTNGYIIILYIKIKDFD